MSPLGENVLKHKLIEDTEEGAGREGSLGYANEPVRGGGYPHWMIPRLLKTMKAERNGDFTVRLPVEDGFGELAEVFNDFVGLNQTFSVEFSRVSKTIGEEGKLTERVNAGTVTGSWKTKVDAINALINAMAQPTTEVGRVITVVAEGDLSKKMMMEIEGRPLKGEFARIGTIVNTMVGQLSSFASEVQGSQGGGHRGQTCGQAMVPGVAERGKTYG